MEPTLLPDNFTRKAPDVHPPGTTHATLAKAQSSETPLRVGGSGARPDACGGVPTGRCLGAGPPVQPASPSLAAPTRPHSVCDGHSEKHPARPAARWSRRPEGATG